jgi:hypothetical protein
MAPFKAFIAAAVLCVGNLTARGALAQLTPTDGGLTVTDSATGITWLANGDFAYGLTPSSPYYVPGINPDGSMSLGTAQAFVANLNTQDYLGHFNWSLPASNPSSPSDCSYPSSGGRFGFSCSGPGNQMGGLFYNGLGGQPRDSILLTHNSNASLFNNLKPYLYWSGTASASPQNGGWSFSFGNGFQGTNINVDSMFVLPEYSPTPTVTVNQPPGVNATTLSVPPPSLVPSADGKLIYDPVANVTWLANGNLAANAANQYGLPINNQGSMDLSTARNWIIALNKHNFMGHSDWMLPTTIASGIDPDCSISGKNPGFPDSGYNCDGSGSQLGELFYDQLGGFPGDDILVSHNLDASFFTDLQAGLYWSDGPSDPNVPNGDPSFSFESGFEGSNFGGAAPGIGNTLFVIPVLPGDQIPEPPSSAILVTGLALLGVAVRNGQRSHFRRDRGGD